MSAEASTGIDKPFELLGVWYVVNTADGYTEWIPEDPDSIIAIAADTEEN